VKYEIYSREVLTSIQYSNVSPRLLGVKGFTTNKSVTIRPFGLSHSPYIQRSLSFLANCDMSADIIFCKNSFISFPLIWIIERFESLEICPDELASSWNFFKSSSLLRSSFIFPLIFSLSFCSSSIMFSKNQGQLLTLIYYWVWTCTKPSST